MDSPKKIDLIKYLNTLAKKDEIIKKFNDNCDALTEAIDYLNSMMIKLQNQLIKESDKMNQGIDWEKN